MSKLARHPYGLKDNAEIKGRVTATPDKGLTVTAPCRSAAEDGAPIKQNQPPSPISLTSTQSSDDVVVCWNNPFAADKESNTIELHWTNDPAARGQQDKKFYTESQFVQDITNSCLKIDIRDGWTTLMAIASNGCNSVSTTISISLTDCPTCHHGDGQSTTAVHDNDRVVPANSEASTDDSSVAPATSAENASIMSDKWSTETIVDGSTTGICRVPRQVEQPVATLNKADYSATIAWTSNNSMASSEFAVKYQVAWDSGSFWENAPRQDVTSAMQSPMVWGGLKPLETYRFAVRAVNDCGAGAWSKSKAVTVDE